MMEITASKGDYPATGHRGRRKLGLSLAGGGFRASLFHLGVLHRMAELDLLRHVEVLSTVSGGSIIGALYTLLLKKYFRDADRDGNLSREKYIELVQELDDTLTKAIKRNLRTLLFLNPLGMLRVMLTEQSLSKRMARIYERHIYNRVVRELEGKPFRWWDYFRLRPGRIKLKEIRPLPGGRQLDVGIEEYNRDASGEGRSVVTSLILNATTLNSGSRFWFSSYEIGDWNLGHFRHSELKLLLTRKEYVQEISIQDIAENLQEARLLINAAEQKVERTPSDEKDVRTARKQERTLSFVLWWRQRKDLSKQKTAVPERWEAFFNEVEDFPGRLADANLGWLRMLKLPAWYLQEGMRRNVEGGSSREEHLMRFWAVLRHIDPGLTSNLQPFIVARPELCNLLLEFVLELYWLRTAEVVSPRIEADWETLTLGEAVGASACFPPVFPPFSILGIYDDAYVTHLGLTDGGVFDNIGLQALLDERCNYIIASDTSGLFDVQQRAASGRLSMMSRIVNILMNNVALRQRDQLRDRRQVSRAITAWPDAPPEVQEVHTLRDLRGLAFFHIRSGAPTIEGLELAVDREDVAMLRTDLDSFGDVEIAALVNTGYDAADRYIRKYLMDFEAGEPWGMPDRFPKPLEKSPRTERIIKVGRSNALRSLSLGATIPVALVVGAVVALVGFTWTSSFSVAELLERVNTLTMHWLDSSMPLLREGWTGQQISVGRMLLAMLLVLFGVNLSRGRLIALIRERNVPLARKYGFVVKWVRSYAGNLLWLFGWLPAILVGLLSVVSAIGYVFFNLPFLFKARNQ